MEIPSWLDEIFLATALQGEENSEPRVTVVQFSAKPAVAAGNNYTSHLFRVHVEYRVGESDLESTSLIVKAPITKGAIMEMTEKLDFFVREPKIYDELLPKMKEKVNIDFGPKIFYCPFKSGMVLKDLKEDGYIMCDKYKQLDYSHCKHAFTTLAKFHATSVACYHDNPSLIESVGEEFFYVDGGPMEKELKPWFKTSFKTMSEITRKIGLVEFADLLLVKADTIWQSVAKICKRKTRGLNVLNHGDLWINNMLFKHNDKGEVTDVKFIDFQISRFTSPVVDLLYLIWTSANEDVRENRLQDLYNTYLQTLNTTLEQLGCEERMTVEELQEDLRSASDWPLVLVSNLLPFMLCEPSDVINMEELKLEDFQQDTPLDSMLKVINGKPFQSLLPNLTKQVLAFTST